jgi:class 3 adenylate cyclase
MSKSVTRQLVVCPEVLIMVLDIARSTEMFDAMGESAACRLISDTIDLALEEIRVAGGEVSTFTGDGLLATWKSGPRAAPVSCVLSLWRRLAMRSMATDAGRRPPVMHGSLHAGSVTICTIAGGRAVMLGQALNIASRLDDLSQQVTGGFVVSRAAAAVLPCGQLAHLCDAGPVSIRGAREPMAVMRLRDPVALAPSAMRHLPGGTAAARPPWTATDCGPTPI